MKKITLLSLALLSVVILAGCDQLQPGQTLPTTLPPANQPTGNTSVPETDVDSNSIAYQNQDYGFTFTPPKEWQTQSRSLMSSLGEKVFVGFTSGFSISVWDLSTYTLDDLKAAPPGGIDPDKITETTITVDGNSATEVSYVSVGDSESKTMKKISILKDNLVYLIEGSAENCSVVLPTFKFTK
ncbi:MAG: hypothetical protein WC702_00795 [Patescibacteria group bacterium]|jgi:hypothetical protein